MSPTDSGVAENDGMLIVGPPPRKPYDDIGIAGGGFKLDSPLSSVVGQRLTVLVTLLLLQSGSQFILERYEGLISANVILPLFLTMLVGAGGNAGNQAAVASITGLVTGEFKLSSWYKVMRKEMLIGLISASVLFVIGFLRVYLFYTGEEGITTGMFETVFSISSSLFLIVLTSVVLGSLLPFLLLVLGLNVEHAAPVIQVVMDILGVFISCFVCSIFLPSTTPAPPQAIPVAGAAAAASAAGAQG